MKVLILAAGIGSRLGNLFPNTPKCLIKLNGKTILETNLDSLESLGISKEDITIVIGGSGDVWNTENQDRIKKIHSNIIINSENISKNQAYSFWLGAKEVNDNLICIDGDTLFSKSVLKKLIEFEYPSCFITKEDLSSDKFRRVVVLKNRVLGIGKELQSNRRYMPILKFGTDFLSALKKELVSNPDVYFNNSIEIPISKICSNNPIYNLNLEDVGEGADRLVVNINTPEEYYSAEKKFTSTKKKNFVILMSGYTAVGKSTTAKKLSQLPNTDIYHSAVVRKELNLTPTNFSDADKIFDFKNGLREDMDRKVYGELARKAESALLGGKNVILDAGYFFEWQRNLIYEKIKPLDVEIFVVRAVCSDEEVIKKRLEERANLFNKEATAETPSWNTYLSTKEITQFPEKDSFDKLNIIEYDTLSNRTFLVKIVNSSCAVEIISKLEQKI